MFLGAIYWARSQKNVFACGRKDAAKIDFDNDFLYDELVKPISLRSIETKQILQKEGLEALHLWDASPNKVQY